MPYGQIKVDQVTFTNAGADQTISVSGIVASISGNITATGTISGNVIRGGTLVSGATVTGTAGQFGTITGNTAGFTTVTGTTVTGTTANFVSGVFSGNSTAAAFIPTGSTVPTNGIYLPSANNVAISTNGSGRLFVDASGNVGLGTSTITLTDTERRTLQIDYTGSNVTRGAEIRLTNSALSGTGATDGASLLFANTDTYLYTREAGFLELGTSNQGRLRITSAGLVGVGTSSPGATLHVEGLGNTVNQYIFTSDNVSNATASLTFGTTPGSRSKAAIQMVNTNTGNAAGALSLLTNDNAGLVSRLYIDSAGKVGVGTTSPASLLTSYPGNVSTLGAKASTGLLVENNGNVGNVSQIGLGYTFSGTYHPVAIAAITTSGSGSTRADLVFATRDLTTDVAPTERARIDSSGRLLVGTSSDSGGALLQINGNRIRIATAKTPASASDTGTTGEVCWDANYIYVCTATNTWKRTAIATW
jgi:hypothetical protein